MSRPRELLRIDVDGGVLFAEHRPGPGPCVVFLHAGVCDRRSVADLVPFLPEEVGFLCYDRRGFGDSPPAGSRFSHLDDLTAVLDTVTEGPAVLVGSSMGGALALDAALTMPERVAGLVLLAPAVSGCPPVPPDDLDAATRSLSEAIDAATEAGGLDEVAELEARLWLDGPTSPAGRVGGAVRELALAMNSVVLHHAVPDCAVPDCAVPDCAVPDRAVPDRAVPDHAGVSGVDVWSRLDEVTVAVTLATGDLDCSYLQTRTEELRRRIPGARRVDLPGVAHLPYLENPALVARVIAGAL
ncbi:MAG: alpha/beta fold hydrolase [Janthinobacterium lividum]